MLDRPRHEDLIDDIRAAGARIKLIPDGDVTATISAAIRGHERPPRDRDRRRAAGGHRGGGAPVPRRRAPGAALADDADRDRRRRPSTGIDDVNRVFTTDDLAPGEVIVAATGVSNSDLLRGVRYLADSARTHSVVMCTRHNWVKFVDGIHFFARERREEVRLCSARRPSTRTELDSCRRSP